MHIWNDSLDYRQSNLLGLQYGSRASNPIGVVSDHEVRGRYSVEGTGELRTPALSYPRPGDFGNETCITGFLCKIVNAALGPVLLRLLTVAGSAEQVICRALTHGDGWRIQFERADTEGTIFGYSAELPLSEWLFLEFQIKVAISTGSIVMRCGGSEVARIENITTETGITRRYWDTLAVSPGASSNRIADWYVLDGLLNEGKTAATFLGKVEHTKIRPGKAVVREWPFTINPPGQRWNLIISAGQSNAEGTQLSSAGRTWASPNTTVEVWDKRTDPFNRRFRPLEANVNSGGAFSPLIPWGAEMQFASRIKWYYESAANSPAPAIKLLKAAQNASFLWPSIQPDFCWNFNTTGNLYNEVNGPRQENLVQDINSAISAQGTPPDRIDFFWYQGEAEAGAQVQAIAAAYDGLLNTFFDRFESDFSYVPTIHIHIIQLHPRSGINVGGFAGLTDLFLVRRLQKSWVESRPNASLIDTHNVEISGDFLHMTADGYDRLGDLMFKSWLEAQDFRREVDDYETSAVFDSFDIQSFDRLEKTASFSPTGLRRSMNSLVLSRSLNVGVRASSPTAQLSPRAAGIALPSLNITSTSSFEGMRTGKYDLALPEALNEDISVKGVF